MLQQKIGLTKCPTKVAILSHVDKFWSAIVRWPTVTCSPWVGYKEIQFSSLPFGHILARQQNPLAQDYQESTSLRFAVNNGNILTRLA